MIGAIKKAHVAKKVILDLVSCINYFVQFL